MDAVTYIKTYERMREAEGLKTFERLFNEEATPEQRVELVEEWGKENPEEPTGDIDRIDRRLTALESQVMFLERRVLELL